MMLMNVKFVRIYI